MSVDINLISTNRIIATNYIYDGHKTGTFRRLCKDTFVSLTKKWFVIRGKPTFEKFLIWLKAICVILFQFYLFLWLILHIFTILCTAVLFEFNVFIYIYFDSKAFFLIQFIQTEWEQQWIVWICSVFFLSFIASRTAKQQ